MGKILLVDDNPDILMVLRVTFEVAGHEVIATEDPREVLALAERNAPDAVVLDVMMPGRSGWEVLREIRERPALVTLPVVLLTALADVQDRVKGLRGGADDYQTKPFDPEELLARVEGLIARRGQRPPAPEVAPSLVEAITELERRIAAREPLDEVRLGRYQVREMLGRGAMGTVMSGWDPKLQRPVALKTIRFNLKDSRRGDREKQVSRLLHEAVTNARINHPNIVTVFDVGEEGKAAFIAMELVEGTNLEAHLAAHGTLSYRQLVPLAAAVARALAAAHGHGILHRDVKPGNVLLGDGSAIKVTDFGISEFLSRANDSGSIFGTPGYLAPESLTGDLTTTASDLFALGATLYECLAGRHPFVERNWRRTLHNTVMEQPRPLAEIVPDLPPRLDDLISRLLAKDRKERPDGAAAVAAELAAIAAAEGLSWKLDAPRRPAPRLRLAATGSRLLPLETLSETLSIEAWPRAASESQEPPAEPEGVPQGRMKSSGSTPRPSATRVM